MLAQLFRAWRVFLAALVDDGDPRRFALGVSLGMMLGLVPKGNLVAVILSVFILTLRLNLAAAMLSAWLFSWVGFLADPAADWIGYRLLTHRQLEPLWGSVYQWPLVPWTRLNNTVVFGSLLLGIWAFCPIYELSRRFSESCGPWILEKTGRYRLVQMLAGAELVARWRRP